MKPIILELKDGVNGKGGVIGKLALYKCNNCSKEWWEGVSQKPLFCNKLCYIENQKNRTKEKSNRWVGGRVKQFGYWCIQQEDGGYKREHRLVMEKYLGRHLKKGEDIHHINGNRLDNGIENLLLVTSSEHHKIHYREHMVVNKKNGRFIGFKSYLEKFI